VTDPRLIAMDETAPVKERPNERWEQWPRARDQGRTAHEGSGPRGARCSRHRRCRLQRRPGSLGRAECGPGKDKLAQVIARGTLVGYAELDYPPQSIRVEGGIRAASTKCSRTR